MSGFVGLMDLAKRWDNYTVRGLRKIIARDDFPLPITKINLGRIPVWHASDIDRYEVARPWLTDREAKRRRVAGYAAALAKKRQQPE